MMQYGVLEIVKPFHRPGYRCIRHSVKLPQQIRYHTQIHKYMTKYTV